MGSHLLVQEWRVLFLLNSTFPWPELGRAAMKIRGCNDRSFVNNLICISTRLYHTYHHIYHGPNVILPWYLLMVCRSEYCSQYFPSLHPRITYFDSLTRDLLYVYRNGSTPSYWPRQIWKSDTSPKCWSARFRMLSLYRRIWSIHFPLTMSNNYLIIKLLRRRILRGVRYGLMHYLWVRVIEDSRENSSPPWWKRGRETNYILWVIVDNS